MAYLPDVNCLIALQWPSHEHHGLVRRWFGRVAAQGWATCPTTQAGLVRLLMNPMVTGTVASFDLAIRSLDALTQHPHHSLWEQSVPFTDTLRAANLKLGGYRQVTDAYLLALAMSRKGKFATLDRSVLALAPKGSKASEALVILE